LKDGVSEWVSERLRLRKTEEKKIIYKIVKKRRQKKNYNNTFNTQEIRELIVSAFFLWCWRVAFARILIKRTRSNESAKKTKTHSAASEICLRFFLLSLFLSLSHSLCLSFAHSSSHILFVFPQLSYDRNLNFDSFSEIYC
jgi:hypothetical protein